MSQKCQRRWLDGSVFSVHIALSGRPRERSFICARTRPAPSPSRMSILQANCVQVFTCRAPLARRWWWPKRRAVSLARREVAARESRPRISMASVANRAHCRRNPRGSEERGRRGGNRLKGWMLAVPRCSGNFSSEHFSIDGPATAGRSKAPQRKGEPFPRVAPR
jgi:hypothetical protein